MGWRTETSAQEQGTVPSQLHLRSMVNYAKLVSKPRGNANDQSMVAVPHDAGVTIPEFGMKWQAKNAILAGGLPGSSGTRSSLRSYMLLSEIRGGLVRATNATAPSAVEMRRLRSTLWNPWRDPMRRSKKLQQEQSHSCMRKTNIKFFAS